MTGTRRHSLLDNSVKYKIVDRTHLNLGLGAPIEAAYVFNDPPLEALVSHTSFALIEVVAHQVL